MQINYLKCMFGGADGFDVDMDKGKDGNHPFIYECRNSANRSRRCTKNNHAIGQQDECEWAKPIQLSILKNGWRV